MLHNYLEKLVQLAHFYLDSDLQLSNSALVFDYIYLYLWVIGLFQVNI